MSTICFRSLVGSYQDPTEELSKPFGQGSFDPFSVIKSTMCRLYSAHLPWPDNGIYFNSGLNELLIDYLFQGSGRFCETLMDWRYYSVVYPGSVVEMRGYDLGVHTQSDSGWHDFTRALMRYCPATKSLRLDRTQAEHLGIALIRAAYVGDWDVIDILLNDPVLSDGGAGLREALLEAHTRLDLA